MLTDFLDKILWLIILDEILKLKRDFVLPFLPLDLTVEFAQTLVKVL